MQQNAWEYLDDPTTTGTFLGLFLTIGHLVGDVPAELAAAPLLIVGIGGIAISLNAGANQTGKSWSWLSMIQGLRYKWTIYGILVHLPQAAIGAALLLS